MSEVLEMQKPPKPVDDANLFGIAKRIHSELSDLPVYQHGAVLAYLQTAGKAREIRLQDEQQRKAQEEHEDRLRQEKYGAHVLKP